VSGPDPGGDGDVVDAASLKDLGGGLSEVGADDDDWGFYFFFCDDDGEGLLHCYGTRGVGGAFDGDFGATPPYIEEVVKLSVTRIVKWSNVVTV